MTVSAMTSQGVHGRAGVQTPGLRNPAGPFISVVRKWRYVLVERLLIQLLRLGGRNSIAAVGAGNAVSHTAGVAGAATVTAVVGNTVHLLPEGNRPFRSTRLGRRCSMGTQALFRVSLRDVLDPIRTRLVPGSGHELDIGVRQEPVRRDIEVLVVFVFHLGMTGVLGLLLGRNLLLRSLRLPPCSSGGIGDSGRSRVGSSRGSSRGSSGGSSGGGSAWRSKASDCFVNTPFNLLSGPADLAKYIPRRILGRLSGNGAHIPAHVASDVVHVEGALRRNMSDSHRKVHDLVLDSLNLGRVDVAGSICSPLGALGGILGHVRELHRQRTHSTMHGVAQVLDGGLGTLRQVLLEAANALRGPAHTLQGLRNNVGRNGRRRRGRRRRRGGGGRRRQNRRIVIVRDLFKQGFKLLFERRKERLWFLFFCRRSRSSSSSSGSGGVIVVEGGGSDGGSGRAIDDIIFSFPLSLAKPLLAHKLAPNTNAIGSIGTTLQRCQQIKHNRTNALQLVDAVIELS